MNNILIIATSLNTKSRSQLLAQLALEEAEKQNIQASILDLRDYPLPLAGNSQDWNNPNAQTIKALMMQHKRFIFAVPVYNFNCNAVAKNLLELCGDSYLEGAVAGFISVGGGKNAYMSILGLMNSLMLDYRVWIAPRFVYATDADRSGADWSSTSHISADTRARINKLVQDVQFGTEQPK